MKKQEVTQVIEDDVVFHDIDPVMHPDGTCKVQPTPSSAWVSFDGHDFIHWLVDSGRLDAYDEEAGRIISDRCGKDVTVFWRELAISKEADKLLNEYLTAEELAQNPVA